VLAEHGSCIAWSIRTALKPLAMVVRGGFGGGPSRGDGKLVETGAALTNHMSPHAHLRHRPDDCPRPVRCVPASAVRTLDRGRRSPPHLSPTPQNKHCPGLGPTGLPTWRTCPLYFLRTTTTGRDPFSDRQLTKPACSRGTCRPKMPLRSPEDVWLSCHQDRTAAGALTRGNKSSPSGAQYGPEKRSTQTALSVGGRPMQFGPSVYFARSPSEAFRTAGPLQNWPRSARPQHHPPNANALPPRQLLLGRWALRVAT